MKLKIKSYDGKEPNFRQLLARNISMFIWPVELILLFLGKQRLGDKRAKTMVVKEGADGDVRQMRQEWYILCFTKELSLASLIV